MKAGRELNIWIAENVMGHTVIRQKNLYFEATPLGSRPLAAYSSEMAAAWQVIEKLSITLIPIEGGQWFSLVGEARGWRSPAEFIQYLQTADFIRSGAAIAESAPVSICLAAYQAAQKARGSSEASEASAVPGLVAKSGVIEEGLETLRGTVSPIRA